MRAAFASFLRSAFRPTWLKAATGGVHREALAKRVFPLGNWPIYMDCLRAYLEQGYDFRDALVGTQVPVIPEGGLLRYRGTQHVLEQRLPTGRVQPARSRRRMKVTRFVIPEGGKPSSATHLWKSVVPYSATVGGPP